MVISFVNIYNRGKDIEEGQVLTNRTILYQRPANEELWFRVLCILIGR